MLNYAFNCRNLEQGLTGWTYILRIFKNLNDSIYPNKYLTPYILIC